MAASHPPYSSSILNEQLVAAALLEQQAIDDVMAVIVEDMLEGEIAAVPCCIEMLQTGRCKYDKPRAEPLAFTPEKPWPRPPPGTKRFKR